MWTLTSPVSGAGPVDSLYEAGKATVDGNVAGIALNTAAVGIDTLGFLANPVDSLATSIIGWLIDHLAFLRFPLDITVGNPDAIQGAVQLWNDTAIELDDIASQQAEALRTQLPTYLNGASTSAPGFKTWMETRETQIRGAAMTCVEIAQLTAEAGANIAAVRSVIRDLTANYIWEMIQKAAVKFAFAPLTLGATATEFLTNALIRASTVMKQIGAKLGELLSTLKVLTGRMKVLAKRFDAIFGATMRMGPKDTLLPSFGLLPLKMPFEMLKEDAKVEGAQTSTTDPASGERATQLHDRLADPAYQERERVRDESSGEPAEYETKDWWTRRGTLS